MAPYDLDHSREAPRFPREVPRLRRGAATVGGFGGHAGAPISYKMQRMSEYLRTLFLHPPSFAGFDGGAGSRYQARREVRSFWYPTWLAQPAALVPGSKLVDAPAARRQLGDVLPLAGDFELAVLHTSTPSFAADLKVAEALK